MTPAPLVLSRWWVESTLSDQGLGMIRASIRAHWLFLTLMLVYGCAVAKGTDGATVSATPLLDQPSRETAARAKVDRRLLDALDRIRAGAEPGSPRNPLDVDAEGRVLVDMTAVVTDELLKQIEVSKGVVVNHFRQYEAIRARLPFNQLIALAERSDVKSIRPAERSITSPSLSRPDAR